MKSEIDEFENALRDEVLLDSSRPALSIAVAVIARDPGNYGLLRDHLLLEHALKLIAKLKPKTGNQMSLPGFEHLPAEMRISENGEQRRVRLLDATFKVLRQYLRGLTNQQQSRAKNNLKISETKLLITRMNRWRRGRRTLTVREMEQLEQNDKEAK